MVTYNPQTGCFAFDTVQEAVEFHRLAGRKPAEATVAKPKPTVAVSPLSNPKGPAEQLRTLFTREDPRKLLAAIAAHPDGIEAGQLCEVSGIKPEGIGGVLSGISKTAGKADLKVTELYASDLSFEGGQRVVRYFPTELLRQAFAAGK